MRRARTSSAIGPSRAPGAAAGWDVPSKVALPFVFSFERVRSSLLVGGLLVGPNGNLVTGIFAYDLAANWQVKTVGADTFEVSGREPGKYRTLWFMGSCRATSSGSTPKSM